MDSNSELLNYIYQNAQMGERTISQLTGITDDPRLLKQLHAQSEEYHDISEDAMGMLREYGHREKELDAMTQAMSRLSVGAKTLADDSTGHIAEMMIQGSTRGIIEATKNLERYLDADRRVRALGHKLLRTEQANVDDMKAFLS